VRILKQIDEKEKSGVGGSTGGDCITYMFVRYNGYRKIKFGVATFASTEIFFHFKIFLNPKFLNFYLDG
jgi:hypothetical protein